MCLWVQQLWGAVHLCVCVSCCHACMYVCTCVCISHRATAAALAPEPGSGAKPHLPSYWNPFKTSWSVGDGLISDALAGEILKTTPTHECTKSEDIDWERRDQNRCDKDGLRNVKNSVRWINAQLSGLNLGSESLSHQLWPWVIFEKNSSLELSVCYKGGPPPELKEALSTRTL